MAYEQILTILLGAGVGVAVVLYAVRSRLFGTSPSIVSGGSSIETFTVPSQSISVSRNDVAPTPVATATQSPVVEAPAEEFHVLSFGAVPPTSAASSDVTIASTDTSAALSPSVTSLASGSRTARATRAPRAPRRSAASPRTTKSRVGSQSIRTAGKALDEATP